MKYLFRLLMLTIDDLKEMGILSYGHRMDLFVSGVFILNYSLPHK